MAIGQPSGNKVQTSDLMRVLLALKNNVMRELNCAEVAIVKQIKNDLIYCTYINNSKITITCIPLLNVEIKINDVVLILFTNSDFKTNLSRIRQNQSTIDNLSDSTHSNNCGIIIGKLFEKEEQ